MSRPESYSQKNQIEIQSDQVTEKSWSVFEKEQAINEFDSGNQIVETVTLPPQINELFVNAKSLLEAGEHSIAKRAFLSVLQQVPNFDPAYKQLVLCLKQMGDYEQALNYLFTRVENDPSFASYYDLASEYYEGGHIDQAEEFYLKALECPHIEGHALFETYKNLGNISLQKKDLSSAEENYNRAYTLNDQSDALLVNFGSLAIYNGQLERAVNCLREAVQLNPRNSKGWIGLGMVHREFGDYELSWANIEKALDYDPQNETAIKLVAEWGLKDNELEKAIRLMIAYDQNCPEDAFNKMILSKYYYLIGRIQPAKVLIEAAYEINPQLEDIEALRDIINVEAQQRGI